MKTIDVLIIGAGAAGLMCAAEAAKRSRSVCVIDHANKAGKKILMSGGGRCNFTNLDVRAEHFISHNPHFCKSALSRYTPWHFVDLVKRHDIPYHEKTLGQLFCDRKSKDILTMLLAECREAGASIALNTTISSIEQHASGGFKVKTHQGDYRCESLVIATGGLSIPTLGASAFGYEVAKQFGHKVWPPRAGLVPFTLNLPLKKRFEDLPGVALDCRVTCHNTTFREAMLFTHRGLSGPAMLQISSYWQPGDTITITLLPDLDLLDALQNTHRDNPNTHVKNALLAYFPKKLLTAFLSDALLETPLQALSRDKLKALAAHFQHWQIKPNGTEGYRTAEVTLGGVDCDAISSKTFESHTTPGLYFIGEVLDITGWLGGYNFQWAWASAVAAAAKV
jgi:predicted Rossmann fold flavoprotein